MMEHDHAAEWMGEVRRGKALGELVAAVKLTDAEGTIIDLSRLQSDGTLADELGDLELVDELGDLELAGELGDLELAGEEPVAQGAPATEEPKAEGIKAKKAETSAAAEEDEAKPAPKKRTPKSED